MATKLFVLMLGVAFVYVGYAYSALARRMRSYKSVQGRVVAREVVVVPSGDTTTGRWGEGGGYTPQVTYRYVVDGVELESNKIARAIRGYKRPVAERKLVEIPEQVVVWYDPSRPGEAYLERHGPALGYAILGLGVALVLGALLAVTGCARDNPPAKPASEASSVAIAKVPSSSAGVTARLSPEKADALARCAHAYPAAPVAPEEAGATAARVATACAALYSQPACAAAFRQFSQTPPEARAANIARACRDAYCPLLDEPRPALCAGEELPEPSAQLSMWPNLDARILSYELGIDVEKLWRLRPAPVVDIAAPAAGGQDEVSISYVTLAPDVSGKLRVWADDKPERLVRSCRRC